MVFTLFGFRQGVIFGFKRNLDTDYFDLVLTLLPSYGLANVFRFGASLVVSDSFVGVGVPGFNGDQVCFWLARLLLSSGAMVKLAGNICLPWPWHGRVSLLATTDTPFSPLRPQRSG